MPFLYLYANENRGNNNIKPSELTEIDGRIIESKTKLILLFNAVIAPTLKTNLPPTSPPLKKAPYPVDSEMFERRVPTVKLLKGTINA
jgi:hypothetical protein